MTTLTATKVLDKFAGDNQVPVVHTLTRPVAGAPVGKLKITSTNATELADKFGDIKRQIKELEETETLYSDAFKTYVRERAAARLKKDETAAPLKNMLITGVVYKVNINIDLESDRFEAKRFTEENPGTAKYYTKTIVYDKVDVRNVK